jgi:hypothetical protein
MLTEYTCKDCGIEGKENFYKYKYQCKACWNKRTYQASRDKLDQLIADRGGCCERCGYSKCNAALQWHHMDPTQKEFGISSKRGSPVESLKKEIDKCTLLCANCHAEVHAGL